MLVGLIFALITNKRYLFDPRNVSFSATVLYIKGISVLTTILVVSIFLEMSYLMRMFFRSREPHPILPQPYSPRTMPLICAPCIWVTTVLIWRMTKGIYLCLLTLWMQNLVPTSASGLPPQSSASLPRESAWLFRQ